MLLMNQFYRLDLRKAKDHFPFDDLRPPTEDRAQAEVSEDALGDWHGH